MRTRDALLLSGACLILVACLHTLFGFEPTAAGLAGTGAAGLAVGLAAPLPACARRDLVLLGGVLLLATAAHATFGVALTVRGLTAVGVAGLIVGALGLLLPERDAVPVADGDSFRPPASVAERAVAPAVAEPADVPEREWEWEWWRSSRRTRTYLAGCVLFSLGVKLFIDSDLGVDPLHSMVIGIVQAVDLPYVGIGLVSSAVTASFLALWSAWNRRLPPLTTFITMALVGYLVDLWNLLGLERWIVPALTPGWTMLTALLLDAYASALIILSGIGIRVMDLVTITMLRRWGCSFLTGKIGLELAFLTVALLLGGPVGIGTVAFVGVVATFITPFMRMNERLLGLPNFGLGPPPPAAAGA